MKVVDRDRSLRSSSRRTNSEHTKEQEVPQRLATLSSAGSTSADPESSSSIPSSPSSFSMVADELFSLPASNNVTKMREPTLTNGKVAAEKATVTACSFSLLQPETVAPQSSSRTKPLLSGKKKKLAAAANVKKDPVSSANEKKPVDQLRLLEKAKSARSFLLPFFDKMPQEVIFATETVEQIKSPSFGTYCAGEHKIVSSTHLQPSQLISHLEDFSKNRDAIKLTKDSFKRPHSPHNQKTAGSVKKIPALMVKKEEENSGDLKSRLQAKLLQFRAQRKALLDPSEAGAVREMRKKLKNIRKKERKNKKKANAIPTSSSTAGEAASSNDAGSATPTSNRSSSVVSEEGKMIFSKFDFFGADGKTPHPKQAAGKNLTHLLNRAEAQQKKLDNLHQTDEEKARVMEEKKAWSEALLKAQGVKLKNDPVKLKRAMKEQQKRKDKSARQWGERKQHVAIEQKQRLDTRDKNILARKTANKNKKRKRSIKKGHIIPGFH